MKIPIASSNSKTISRTSREGSKPPKAKSGKQTSTLREAYNPHMNQSLYTLFLDTISISLYANGNSYSQHRGKLMKNESEKLKYQTPHHTHGAPNWGLNGIESI
jgi:hypothetical protein